MKKNVFMNIAAVSALTLSSVMAYADTSDYMAQARRNANEAGYYSTGFAQYDSLSEDERRTYTMRTTPGVRYAVIGVCDIDCTDLDIAISKDGTVLETDYETDDNPIVQFTAHASSYQVRVDMEDCSNNPCYYRIEGFSK